MNIKMTKIGFIIAFQFLCITNDCLAQNDSSYVVYAEKIVVTDSVFREFVDTMYSLTDVCRLDKSILFFYICESEFEGTIGFYGEVKPLAKSSYLEMWDNGKMPNNQESFWKLGYFYHNGILCLCNFDHDFFIEKQSDMLDALYLPINSKIDDSFNILVVPRNGNEKKEKYDIYFSCNCF